MRRRGWILDVYPVAEGMCVWIIDDSGRAFPCIDPWTPHFYIRSRSNNADQLERVLKSLHLPLAISVAEKKDFFSKRTMNVLSVRVESPPAFSTAVQPLLTMPAVELFNVDLSLPQFYFYERGLFPLAFCSFDLDDNNRIRAWTLEDSPWELEYALPPLRYAHLELESPQGVGDRMDPSHRRRGRYVLTLGSRRGEGRSYAMDAGERDLIEGLNRHIADWDPDIIVSEGGDGFIMPRLEMYSNRTGIPLNFSRDAAKSALAPAGRKTAPSSFFSYGKMIYKAGSRTLFGRLHIDARNSFTVGHNGLDGLFEIARVAKIPLQRAARCTIGSCLSSMQHAWAIAHDYLIPLDKGQTEDFRSAEDLIAADRGGLVYEPEVGWHEDVIEFDFASMYPEIMIRHNVTPEAVNCDCCPDNNVPGLNHHLCKQRGMVPDVLEPLVKKRGIYKKMIKENHPNKRAFKARYDAFKWALVCCFGYLGYRNARFGRIEAHECVNAYSRDALLQAKEIAEQEGFHFIHAIVDSLWLKKTGATDADVEAVRRKIEMATDLPLGLEGRYRWLRFYPSRTNKLVGVPTRYAGAFTHGEIKVRGIELRRRDTPLFIKRLQEELLEAMASAKDLNELWQREDMLCSIVARYRERLRTGQVTPEELAITLHLSQKPSEYVHDTLSALAAKKMEASGIVLHAGEAIQYVVAEEKDKVKDWRVLPLAFIEDSFEYDRKYYERLMDRALEILPDFTALPLCGVG